jgi:hypothetical protein
MGNKKYTQLRKASEIAATARDATDPIVVDVHSEEFSNDTQNPAIIVHGLVSAETASLLLYIRELDDWVVVPDDAGNAFAFSATRQVAAVLVPGRYGITKAAATTNDYAIYVQY